MGFLKNAVKKSNSGDAYVVQGGRLEAPKIRNKYTLAGAGIGAAVGAGSRLALGKRSKWGIGPLLVALGMTTGGGALAGRMAYRRRMRDTLLLNSLVAQKKKD